MESYNLDFDRKRRLGFPEIVYGASKPVAALVAILNQYQLHQEPALVTKLQKAKMKSLSKHFPAAFCDPISGIFVLNRRESGLKVGEVAILSGGTADQYIVHESLYTLEYLGYKATIHQDIGVAGIHRLLDRLEDLKKVKVLIVVAGFEGALASVVGGLCPQPIIAVPTSIGYGVAKGGKAALSSMLSSCANGITVVNIDNGCGAALAATRILNALS